MIRIVDYGVGNVRAFLNVFKRLNIDAAAAQSPSDLRDARKLILPGVGHFGHAMARLQDSGMRETLDELVLQSKVPVLGVCVGMQMLAHGSDEATRPGLGWVPGRVRSFESWAPARDLPRPHMGWNDVQPVAEHRLFRDLDPAATPRFYFLHSYYFECEQPDHVAAVASYGGEFGCAVSAGHIHGVQFHPEKSHHFGTGLLKNFAEL